MHKYNTNSPCQRHRFLSIKLGLFVNDYFSGPHGVCAMCRLHFSYLTPSERLPFHYERVASENVLLSEWPEWVTGWMGGWFVLTWYRLVF